ncbi:CLUMA_CG008272, isoform A [Clunio marinus]|uniref:CLUMA_CG008272, isoform A n=1 Tax=Clunio marinus TaxID=568069 RepID=A0A1J1I4U2_9DIPT|nr:CLUMA_CG008272, isoform A [Clunio marinus]
MLIKSSCLLLLATFITIANAIDKGVHVGCFKRSSHSISNNLRYVKNCFNYCAGQFYRFSVFSDETCSCENFLKESEQEGTNCSKKCLNEDEEVSCGGDETESIYETGSNAPGAVKNLKVQDTKEDKITIMFEPPERNGTELSGYEINAMVMKTYSNTPWAMRNQTWKAQKTVKKFDLSNLTPSTQYKIFIKSKNGDVDGGEDQIVASTNLAAPDPKPEPPKILEESDKKVKIEIKRAENNNGPVTKYLIAVHFVDNELIHDFDETLLNTFEKAQEDGINYYITGEIDPFREEVKTFVIGDGRQYGRYFNAPLPDRHIHVRAGVFSRLNNEEKSSFSDSSHDISHDAVFILPPEEKEAGDGLVTFLTIACIICGLILLGSVLFYGYIRVTRTNPRRRRFERHEMSLQGPILEVDNNGFIADVSGINFKDKLQEVLLSLDDDQKIIRKNLALDIDNILGIGSFGDVIRGQLNGNIPCQVHVVSADDMDPPIQMKFIRDLNSLLQFGFHKNMLNFMGICQTHDWFFVIFEDTPATLKQFLLTHRDDQNLSSRRLTNLGEDQALKLMFELSETMEYLQYNKIVHKNLNSYNVRVKRQNSVFSIKISTFGPTLYSINDDGTKSMVDEDRWFAPEVLRFQKYSHASDVYSLALIFWEICCVGGTIYGSLATSDLLVRIKKGIRPEKYPFISEDLYQLLLNCWELDPNERCDFNDIVGQMKHLQLSPQYYLNFSLDGPLPYHLPLLEAKVFQMSFLRFLSNDDNRSKIKLPTFDGNKSKYQTFMLTFDCIMDGWKMPAELRLMYLQFNCLKGLAQIVAGPYQKISEENYHLVRERLHECFNDPRWCVQESLQNIVDSKITNWKSEKIMQHKIELLNNHDTIIRNKATLENLLVMLHIKSLPQKIQEKFILKREDSRIMSTLEEYATFLTVELLNSADVKKITENRTKMTS